MPRALVIDLWGSATLRTGGEEIAQGLALMGCRPIWDHATGRVTGIEVLPSAALGRPRVDVTWRISGLFRDLFPAQIALIDAATRAVAARDETPTTKTRWPRRVATATGAALARIFGTAPGAYGAGVEDLLGHDAGRDDIGAAYLAAASHAYGGADGEGHTRPAPSRRASPPPTCCCTSRRSRARPARRLGRRRLTSAALPRPPPRSAASPTSSCSTRPIRAGRARGPLPEALARIVRARAVNPRFIAGQMRHGPRGAAELAETVDRLVGFAETTDAVPSALLDLVHDAYLADPQVRAFLLRENPAAARAIAERLDAARRRGLWHPRRNDIDASLAALRAEAAA